MDIAVFMEDFISKIRSIDIDIYNESSIQYELAIFLRDKLQNYKIQLERNITFFGLNKDEFEKKEIDIVVFNEDKSDITAIEIKFPTNGQYPEQMFSFCKDIKFLEQLSEKGFRNNLFIAFANDSNFWNNKGDEGTIYYNFRTKKELSGVIVKPTGKKDQQIHLCGNYRIEWKVVNQGLRYFTIMVK